MNFSTPGCACNATEEATSGFGKRLRKGLKRARKLGKKAIKATWKTATLPSHVISKRALGGALDPWTREGRMAGAQVAVGAGLAFATGGAGAAGLSAFGGIARNAFGGGSYAADELFIPETRRDELPALSNEYGPPMPTANNSSRWWTIGGLSLAAAAGIYLWRN